MFALPALATISRPEPAAAAAAEGSGPWASLAPAASGALQGIAQNLVKQVVLHPFDTIKTRLQAPAADALGRGELFQDLYRGFLPVIVSSTPGSATFFAAKEAATAELLARGAPKELRTVGGVVAGVLSAKAVRTPFDVAETRAMASKPGSEPLSWDGSWDSARRAVESEGFFGLYRGYGANVAYKLPADAAKFLAYEALRDSGAAGALPAGVAGAMATLASSAVTTPLDVLRTRAMLEGPSGKGRGLIGVVQDVQASGDYGQLWAGLGWRIARGVVAGAIQFSVLEGTKKAVTGGR